MTLDELARALAAHALLVAHPEKLHDFFAPEMVEDVAAFIVGVARGERVARPQPSEDQA